MIVHIFRTFTIFKQTYIILWSAQLKLGTGMLKENPQLYLEGNLISCQPKSALTFSELAPMDYVHKAYEPPGIT